MMQQNGISLRVMIQSANSDWMINFATEEKKLKGNSHLTLHTYKSKLT